MKTNDITSAIIGTAISIHRKIGPGLYESVYERILVHELRKQGFTCEVQKQIPVVYDSFVFPDAFRADIIVNNCVLIELKSVEELHKVHYRQTVTYLKVSDLTVGLLINFNVPILKDGIHRFVNGPQDETVDF